MPTEKNKKQSWSLNTAQLVAAADIGDQDTIARAEKERLDNRSMFQRKQETERKKRGKEKARRAVSQELYGDRDQKPPKNAAQAKAAADKAIANLEAKIADINRRSAANYKGKRPLTKDKARGLKRSLGRNMMNAIDSSKPFVSEYKFKDSSGREQTVSANRVANKDSRASNRRGAGDGNLGREAFGDEAGRVRAVAEKLAGKNYSGKRQDPNAPVFKIDDQGRRQYGPQTGGVARRDVREGRRVAKSGQFGKGKFESNMPRRPQGRPTGSGYDPNNPYKG